MAARALHVPEDTSAPASDARRADAVSRHDLDRSRQEIGALLAAAREHVGASGRAVALACRVNEATLRRWESGEVSAPLDVIDRLPPSVGARLVELLDLRARARVMPRVSEGDYLRTVTASYAAVLNARADGAAAEVAALLDLSNVSRTSAGGKLR